MLWLLVQVKQEETGTIHVIKQKQLHLSCDIISLSVRTQTFSVEVTTSLVLLRRSKYSHVRHVVLEI